MNVITIMSDSLRYDHLGCNGNPYIRTPNIDRFARESAMVFDNAYCGSFPTIPNRTDIHTGYWTFLRRGWTPLQAGDITLAGHLSSNGIPSMHIWDTPHLNKSNFQQGFAGWKLIRGQEGDGFEIPDAGTARFDREKCHDRLAPSHLANHKDRRFEQDYACAKTFAAAERWLERNYTRDGFYLAIDTFDPHEPWDPPQWMIDMYDTAYDGHAPILIPWYQFCDDWTEAQIRQTRARYAGEVTLVDRAIGRFMTKVEDMGLLDNTVIVFMSDHGHLLGEHGRFGKSNRDGKRFVDQDPRYKAGWHLYRDITHLVMMLHVPGVEAGRTSAIMQPVDLFPTICEAMGIDKPDTLEGSSLMPVLGDETQTHRDFAVTSGFGDDASFTLTDGAHSLLFAGDGAEPAFYDLVADPGEDNNLMAERGRDAAGLRERFMEYFGTIVDDKSKLDRFAAAG